MMGQTRVVRQTQDGNMRYDGNADVPGLTPITARGATAAISTAPAAVFTVTTTEDTGDGSLRKAIEDANASPGLDLINFAILGTPEIYPMTELPQITSPVIIDGTTQTGYVGTPIVIIDGFNLSGALNGLTLMPGAVGSTVRGLVVTSFTNHGILVNANSVVVEGCYAGIASDGLTPGGNKGAGVFVQDASDCRVGGTLPAQRNVLSGNTLWGVMIRGLSQRDTVLGNYIGTTADGMVALGNGYDGVRLNIYIINGAGASHCVVGGSTPEARNLISGNDSAGVALVGQVVTNNTIIGNYIGTDVTGTAALPNVKDGVRFWNSMAITFGSPSSNVVGGITAGDRNIIAGNGDHGVWIVGGSSGGTDNTIIGNYIGTDITGLVKIPNGGNGVFLTTNVNGGTIANTRIGGGSPDSANIISGSALAGIYLLGDGVTYTSVVGNRIGLNASSPVPDTIPNGSSGVKIELAQNSVVGRGTPETANLIGGNGANGIYVLSISNLPMAISGNLIGTEQSRTVNLGNRLDGIRIAAPGITVGGDTRDSGNVIAFNRGGGVSVFSGTGNRIRNNAIFSNKARPGIDLGHNGITKNDSSDSDTGPNDYQNFPLLDSVVTSGGSTMVYGRMDSAKSSVELRIDLYEANVADSLHFGGADSLVGTTTVTTDNFGNAAFVVTIPRVVPPSHVFSATATDATGNTSEFSQALSGDSDGDGIFDSWETKGWGIDVNSDGVIDLDLWALGARPDHKDVFVEVDAMAGLAPDELVALGAVEGAFAAAPNSLVHNPDNTNGINLHTLLDDINIPRQPWSSYLTALDSFFILKKTYFGSREDSASPNSRFILEAKKLVFRYCIFADRFDEEHHSGAAELPPSSVGVGKNDFFVSLGGWPTDGGTPAQQAGTFMHELGHTLGLGHGGGDDIKYKPNYISVMNYTWMDPLKNWMPPGAWSLRYSTSALPSLNENSLNELNGLGATAGQYPLNMPVPFRDGFAKIHWARLAPGRKVDWDGNGDSTQTAVPVDISLLDLGENSVFQILNGYNDWSSLVYNFRTSPSFTNSPKASRLVSIQVDEMTPRIYDLLNNIPPPRPVGLFSMDGQLDSSSLLLTSNEGIDLYYAMSGSQLYVATKSAQLQGADVFVFVAVVPGTPQNSPRNKAGKVAKWSAVLTNRSSDNSSGWQDGSSLDLSSISIDTAGSFLEGVIDLEFMSGASPPRVYLAVGKYDSLDGGVLLAQAPAGNADGNIDSNEFAPIDIISGVRDGSMPASFALYQNYPNPFNPSTIIKYELPHSSFVTLNVYNTLGQEVSTLVNENKAAGTYTVEFDGKKLASGVYFYRIQAGQFVQSRKMIVLK
jgi:hypothetical protein